MHDLLAFDQALVHVDVDDVGAGFDLLLRDAQRFLEFIFLDELGEFRRPADVRALADVDEIRLRADGQRLKPAEMRVAVRGRNLARREAFDALADRADVFGRRPAAAADNVEPAVGGPLFKLRRERLRRLRKSGGQQGIGQPRVGVRAEINRRFLLQFLDERTHLLRPQRAVQAHAQQRHV